MRYDKPDPQIGGSPPTPHGFDVMSLSCVPCGERVDIRDKAIDKWIEKHADHVRTFLESHTFRRFTWSAPHRY